MKSAFTKYAFWRGDISFRVQLQSNAFLSGAVVVAWVPLCTAAEALVLYTGNLRSLSVTKHVVLYAGQCASVELKVPFVHYKTHLDLRAQTTENALGMFIIYVQNALRAGDTATLTAASISIFAKFDNSDFQVINPTTTSIVAQGGIQSKVTNVNIESVVGSTIDASATGDSFAGGTTNATLDKPNIGLAAPPLQSRPYPILANTSNIDYCVNLDMPASSRPITTSVFTGTTQDEMDMRYLTQKYSFLDSFSLNTTNTLGQALFVGDLCPGFEFFTAPQGTSLTPTLLSFISLPFSFWKGSLRYKIVAVATPMHSARLQICSHIGYEAAGLSINEAFGQYTCIFDVKGVTEIEISFPWRSPTEWKKVNNGSNPNASDYSMGQFSVRVLNPLQTVETVASTIDFNIYFAGGPDYKLAYLGSNSVDFGITNYN